MGFVVVVEVLIAASGVEGGYSTTLFNGAIEDYFYLVSQRQDVMTKGNNCVELRTDSGTMEMLMERN